MKVMGYAVLGYPSMQSSVELCRRYVAGGCTAIELGFPLRENREAPYLSDLMHQALDKNSDYDDYLSATAQIVCENPETEFTLLMYNEVVLRIGAEKLARFCVENKIGYINSGDLNDAASVRILKESGVKLAGIVHYLFTEEELTLCAASNGFIYMQAYPRPGQELHPGYETPESIIRLVRERGIFNPIYCGGGIREPAQARELKKAGADGFFLGTSVLTLHDKPDEMLETVRSFCDAVR